MTDYNVLEKQMNSILEDNDYSITILSNASALLNEALDDINWVGFYILKNDVLLLGPFQGKVACTKIKVGKGVCGACARDEKTILVEDVHSFSGHIACDSRSNSEICVPIIINNILFGLLDIDSPTLSRFTEEDSIGLEEIVKVISTQLEKSFDIAC